MSNYCLMSNLLPKEKVTAFYLVLKLLCKNAAYIYKISLHIHIFTGKPLSSSHRSKIIKQRYSEILKADSQTNNHINYNAYSRKMVKQRLQKKRL